MVSTTPEPRTTPIRLVIAIWCAMILVCDLLSLAAVHPMGSRVGGVIANVFGWESRPTRTGPHPWVRALVAHSPDGPIIAVGHELLPESAKDLPTSEFLIFPSRISHGFWAPTRRELDRGLYIVEETDSKPMNLPPEEMRRPIRAFIATTFEPARLAEYDRMIASNGKSTVPLVGGYVHDAFATTIGSVMVLCLGSLVLDKARCGRSNRSRGSSQTFDATS